MSSQSETSRRLVAQLRPGEHALYNDELRAAYGRRRVTAKARGQIASELERAGLTVLSDPAREPLIVRKDAARGGAVARSRTAHWRRRLGIALAGVVALLVLAVLLSGGSESQADKALSAAAPTATQTPAATAQAASEPVPPRRWLMRERPSRTTTTKVRW